tara:strand:- start:55 stop:543 length:489 start_codon:yes stop_codon:yes gene_type:complete
MKLNELPIETRFQLSVFQSFTTNILGVDLKKLSKQIRDNLDPLEGHLTGRLNSRGNYNHRYFKDNCPYISVAALKLKNSGVSSSEFGSLTIREHAKPLAVMIQECEGLGGQHLLDYLEHSLRSVVITVEEDKIIGKEFKSTTPDSSNIFARYDQYGIKIVQK